MFFGSVANNKAEIEKPAVKTKSQSAKKWGSCSAKNGKSHLSKFFGGICGSHQLVPPPFNACHHQIVPSP